MSGISAIITTFNEEEHITEAIRSVAWCDEILVVDSNSTDSTTKKITAEGITPLIHDYESPAKQKNWVIPQASNDYILLLDADERCTPELKQEVELLMASGKLKDAYWIYRRNHFMGKEVKYSGWQDDRVIRFFHRDRCRYTETLVHEEIETKGEVGKLKNKLIHFTFRSLEHYMEKFDRYTTHSAIDRAPKVTGVNLYHLLIKPAVRFIRHYFLKLGFLDGRVGFIISAMSAYSVFLRYLKIKELKRVE